jgi:hypothetical protein
MRCTDVDSPCSGNLKFTFHKMRPFDPMNKVGQVPDPEDFIDEDVDELEQQEIEIDDLF